MKTTHSSFAQTLRKRVSELEQRARSRGNILIYVPGKGYVEISDAFKDASRFEKAMEANRVVRLAKQKTAHPLSWNEQVDGSLRAATGVAALLTGLIIGLSNATQRKKHV